MIFYYNALTNTGEKREGSIEAVSKELAIVGLQHRGLIVTIIKNEKESKKWYEITLFERVPVKEIVILSRQMATLFDAQVSALKAFSLLANNVENKLLQRKLNEVVIDIQAGSNISTALSKHKDIFSDFYINMVKAGEESGKLNQVFAYLADYLDREYAINSKTKNALVYPAFVIGIFFAVMILMLTVIVPRISAIIVDSGQDIPWYTQMVIGASNVLVHYWLFLVIGILSIVVLIFWALTSKVGKEKLDAIKLDVPILGKMYQKLYLARFADNMDTMLSSGIPIVRAIEITANVVGNQHYREVFTDAMNKVKSGVALSTALEAHTELPKILPSIIKIGEETGSLGSILKMLAKFYEREVNEAVDTLVGLIEPFMIVFLGIGVGVLLVSILVPIYNIAGGIQ